MKKIIIVALCLCANAYAENTDKTLNLTRANAVSIALANSPQLRAVKTSIDASKGKLEQSGRLDNPSLGLSYGNDFLFGKEGEDALEISISQKFPLFGRLSKEKDIAKIDIDLASLEYKQAEKDLALSVEIAYINSLKVAENLAKSQRQFKLFQDIKNYLHSSCQRAEGSHLDCLSATNECERLAIEVEQAKIDYETSILELKGLLAIDKDIRLADNLEIIATSDKSFSESVLSLRYDYQMLLKAKDSVKAQVALIEAEKFEDIEVGIFLETANSCDVPVGLKRESAIGISLSIPLPIKSFNGAISEKIAMRRKVEELALDAEIKIKNEIRIYSLRAKRLEQILKNKESQSIANSLELYEKYLEAYENAQLSIAEVFAVWQQHLALLEMDIDIKTEQAINSIKLNYALGNFENEK
ncbi:MAG: TolC family protein [Opitutales bacterium]